MSEQRKTDLASPTGCIEELAEIDKEIAEFDHLWAAAAGELKERNLFQARMHRTALRSIKNPELKVAEKDAAAHAAVEEAQPGLAEKIEALEGKVEEFKTLFKTLDRRSSNTQSRLSAMRDEARGMSHAQQPSWTH